MLKLLFMKKRNAPIPTMEIRQMFLLSPPALLPVLLPMLSLEDQPYQGLHPHQYLVLHRNWRPYESLLRQHVSTFRVTNEDVSIRKH